MKSKVISLKFVSEADEPVGYLMVETDDEKFAKQTARRWAESKDPRPEDVALICPQRGLYGLRT